jgi:FkbM family methyltransferase
MGNYRYSAFQKVAFYASYFWYKLILPLEVKSPRLRLWWFELGYTLHKFRDYEYCMPWTSPVNEISTRFGKFIIRKNTNDATNVSPAFERRDINILLRKTGALLASGKRVLFLDVGGDIGTYSVVVGNRYKNDTIDIICFEPVPMNYETLKQNIELNGLGDKVEVMETALMDGDIEHLEFSLNTSAPGSSGISGTGDTIEVKATRMDKAVGDRVAGYDAVVMKLDVEGAEENVLRGAENLETSGKQVHLLVEDFVQPSIIAYLQETGWRFAGKYTDYNSWWIKG